MDTHKDAIQKFDGEERYFSAIGRFIVTFSQLEAILKLWISESIGLRDDFQDLIITHDFAMLCKISETTLPLGQKNGSSEALRPILSKMYELNAHRVRIAHGWWLVGGVNSFLSHVSRQQLTAKGYYSDAAEIAALADRIDNLAMELQAWQKQYCISARS